MAESARHWSRVTESGTVLGMRILFGIYRLFGRWVFRVFLFPVIGYFYLTNRRARQASQTYLLKLRETYPEIPPQSSFKHLWMFGEMVLDKLLVWMEHIRFSNIRYHSDGVFEATRQKQQGGLIVISHLGNTEICNALAYQQGDIKLTVLVYNQHVEKFNALMKQVGAMEQVEVYQVTDMSPAFAMMMAERVEAGEFVVIAGDRTPVTGQQRTSTVNFLGSPAAFPQGAFILASLLKCPVFLMFCLKTHGRYDLHIECFSEQLKLNRQQRNILLDKTVQDYADRLAEYARRAPLQWFNFYPFWEDTTSNQVENKE